MVGSGLRDVVATTTGVFRGVCSARTHDSPLRRRRCSSKRFRLTTNRRGKSVTLRDPLCVLHVSPTFWPATAWGGPIYSTKALCDGLAEAGIALTVLTSDSSGPRRTDRLTLAHNPALFPAGYKVHYAAALYGRDLAPGLLSKLVAMVRRADLVHLTATYSFPTLPTMIACKVLGKPLVWSPRGALQATEEWAAARTTKKRAFEALCRRALPPHAALHVTAEVEARLSARAVPGVPIHVIPNSVDVPAAIPPKPQHQGLRLMFLSRLHEKKGLDILLHALADLPPDITLDVYGEGEQAFLDATKALTGSLGLADRVTFHGHVDGADKAAAFERANLFVLPSHSENFGNVIAEALAHAVPVIASTGTPWAGLETHGCGAWVAAEKEAVRGAVERLRTGNLAQMGEKGRQWMADQFSNTAVSRRMIEVYRQMDC